jgi:hypothetical protein
MVKDFGDMKCNLTTENKAIPTSVISATHESSKGVTVSVTEQRHPPAVLAG